MRSRETVVLAFAVGGVLASAAVEAQVLEEVIVTAQKREESLQDVGISVSAFSGEQLKALGVSSTVDITQQVPGLQLFTFSPAFTVFSLRGVSQNNFQDNLEAPVAVYMDGAYVASMNAINSQLFDMDRVEVLRGPQGTLFGRNATGGLIHFLTRKAEEDEANGYLEAGAAEFGTYSVEGAVGGGFSDTMRGRLAGRWQDSDGYVKAGTAFGVPATGRTSHGADGYALRGNLQIDATENVLVDLTAAYSKDDDVPSGQYVVSLAGFDPDTGLGAFTDAIDPATGEPTDFSPTPITGDVHRHWSNENPYFDRETTLRSPRRSPRSSAGRSSSRSPTGSKWTSSTSRTRAAGSGSSRTTRSTTTTSGRRSCGCPATRAPALDSSGAYYLDMTWDTFQSVAGALILGGTSDTQKMSTFGVVDSTNWSAFGQVEYDLAEQWTVVAGLRWSQDDKDLEMRRVYEDVPEGIPPAETVQHRRRRDPGDRHDRLRRLRGAAAAQLQARRRHAALCVVQPRHQGRQLVARPAGRRARREPAASAKKCSRPTSSGSRPTCWDGAARLNMAAFYYDYDDYQSFSILGLTPQVANSDAEATGGEIELIASPT